MNKEERPEAPTPLPNKKEPKEAQVQEKQMGEQSSSGPTSTAIQRSETSATSETLKRRADLWLRESGGDKGQQEKRSRMSRSEDSPAGPKLLAGPRQPSVPPVPNDPSEAASAGLMEQREPERRLPQQAPAFSDPSRQSQFYTTSPSLASQLPPFGGPLSHQQLAAHSMHPSAFLSSSSTGVGRGGILGQGSNLASIIALHQQQQGQRLSSAAGGQIFVNPLAATARADPGLLQHLLLSGQVPNPRFPSFPQDWGAAAAMQYNRGQLYPGVASGAIFPQRHAGAPSGWGNQASSAQQSSFGGAGISTGDMLAVSPGGAGVGGALRGPLSTNRQRGDQKNKGKSSAPPVRQNLTAADIGPDVPESLPAVLALPEDETKLSAYQLLIRNQIEAFSASADTIATHARGRNRPISLNQVGIRCRHCKHLPPNQRKKGSVYFPFSVVGFYQAAQNMGSSHFHGESCHEMSPELKKEFVDILACKSTVGSGKQYWARTALKLGLVDTEEGVRFIRDLVSESSPSS